MASAQDGAAGAAPINLEPRVRELEETVPPVPGRNAPPRESAVRQRDRFARSPATPPAAAAPSLPSRPLFCQTPRGEPRRSQRAGTTASSSGRPINAYLLRIHRPDPVLTSAANLDAHDQTDVDTFLLASGSFGIEPRFSSITNSAFLPDFGVGKAVIQDSYLNVHYWTRFGNSRFGKFKQPFSYEQLIQDRFVPTLERSIIDRSFRPRRGCDDSRFRSYSATRVDFALAVSNGEINGDGDSNNQGLRRAVWPCGL